MNFDAEYRPTKAEDRGIMPRKDLLFYMSQHRSAGCKITHMFGVPLIVLAIILAPFPGQRKKAVGLFSFGWVLQFIGHFVFEHNSPVFTEMRSVPTALSALLMVYHEWHRLFTGKDIVRS